MDLLELTHGVTLLGSYGFNSEYRVKDTDVGVCKVGDIYSYYISKDGK